MLKNVGSANGTKEPSIGLSFDDSDVDGDGNTVVAGTGAEVTLLDGATAIVSVGGGEDVGLSFDKTVGCIELISVGLGTLP
jgi:hypothetical protein